MKRIVRLFVMESSVGLPPFIAQGEWELRDSPAGKLLRVYNPSIYREQDGKLVKENLSPDTEKDVADKLAEGLVRSGAVADEL